jgi:hypothetical protein
MIRTLAVFLLLLDTVWVSFEGCGKGITKRR